MRTYTLIEGKRGFVKEIFMPGHKQNESSENPTKRSKKVKANESTKELENKLKRKKLIIDKGNLDGKSDSIDQTF